MELYSERLLEAGQPPVPGADGMAPARAETLYPLMLGCAKSVAFCHSQHRNLASLRRLVPDPYIEIAQADAAARAIGHGEWVRVKTEAGAIVAKAIVVSGLAPGAVFGLHGWWAAGDGNSPYGPQFPLAANFNNAISTEREDPVSGSIPLRCTPCEVVKLG